MADDRWQGGEVLAQRFRVDGFFAFDDLEIYQLSLNFSAAIYEVSSAFPDSERFGLTNQIRRAATSIAQNIAEGRGRGSDKDFARFLWQARGSLFEVVSALQIAQKLKFINESQFITILPNAKQLGAKITALINTLNSPQ
jgi:four helix bundle protein